MDAFARWQEETYRPFVARNPERKDRFATDSGIELHPLYVAPEPCYDPDRLGFPGQFPYTRGIQPTMYRGRLWTMRQYAGYSTAEESNARYRYLLSQGVTGLSVAFDLPTQIGYDSDHPMAEGEVGKVGVAIDSLQDMEVLFEGIPLGEVSTSMTINATAAILLAMYVAVAEKQGVDRRQLRGTIQNDILKEYAARGTYIYPPRPSMRLVTDIFEWAAREVPRWNTISISGYHIREAGATAVQELAFTLANGIAYVRAAIERGLDVNVFGAQLSFFFNAHNHFFEEIAKFRAARRMWAHIMRDWFGATNPRAQMLRFHTQTGGSTLTAQQVENNIVRVTVQALAAILGGTQSLHTNAKDEALGLPTEESARTALRTQQILAYESGVADVIDPLGGSYFIEALTDELERRAWELIERIEAMGGAVAAIERGFYQEEIARSAYAYQQAVERGEKIIVGVNAFQVEEEESVPIFRVDEAVRDRQIARLRRLKAERSEASVQEALERLRRAAEGTQNLMPYILEAVRVYATLGEISDTLRAVWGEYRG
jgi:methylmalonyl-CoA mutase N-terminal domain/subunit